MLVVKYTEVLRIVIACLWGGSAAGEHTANSETQMWTLWVFEKAFLLCTFYFITSNFILCPSLIIFFLSVLLLNLQVCVLGPGKR